MRDCKNLHVQVKKSTKERVVLFRGTSVPMITICVQYIYFKYFHLKNKIKKRKWVDF